MTECKCEIRRCHLCDGVEVDKFCVNKTCDEYKGYMRWKNESSKSRRNK